MSRDKGTKVLSNQRRLVEKFGLTDMEALALGVDGATYGGWVGGLVTLEQSSGPGAVNGTDWRMTAGASQAYLTSIDMGFSGATLDDFRDLNV